METREETFWKMLENERIEKSFLTHLLSVAKSFEQIVNITSTETIKKHYYDCPRRDVHRMLLLSTIKEVYLCWNQKLYESFLTDGKGNVQIITQMVWGRFRDHWNELMKQRNVIRYLNTESHKTRVKTE